MSAEVEFGPKFPLLRSVGGVEVEVERCALETVLPDLTRLITCNNENQNNNDNYNYINQHNGSNDNKTMVARFIIRIITIKIMIIMIIIVIIIIIIVIIRMMILKIENTCTKI